MRGMKIVARHNNGAVTTYESITPTVEWTPAFAYNVAEAIFRTQCNGHKHVSVAFWDGEVLYNSYTTEDFPCAAT